jgi:hypothetical protein
VQNLKFFEKSNIAKDADNNSKHLPEQYRFLLKKL